MGKIFSLFEVGGGSIGDFVEELRRNGRNLDNRLPVEGLLAGGEGDGSGGEGDPSEVSISC